MKSSKIKKYILKILTKIVDTGLFLIICLLPIQYSIKIYGAHCTIADILIWFFSLLLLIKFLFNSPVEEIIKILKNNGLRDYLITSILFLLSISLSLFSYPSFSMFKQQAFGSLKEIIQYFEYFFLLFFLYANSRYLKKTEKLINIFYFITGIIIIIALFQYIAGNKVTATFTNNNLYSGFVAMTIPVFLAFLTYTTPVKKRLFQKTSMVVIMIAAFFTIFTVVSIIALFFAGAFVCGTKSLKALLIWIFCFLIAFVIYMHLPNHKYSDIVKPIMPFNNNELNFRYIEWQASLNMWKEHPLTGVGIGNYQKNIGMYYGYLPFREGPKPESHNNLFLIILSTSGIFGLIFFLLLLFTLTKSSLILFLFSKDEYQKILTIGLVGMLIAFSINSIYTSLMVRGIGSLIPCIWGIIISGEIKNKTYSSYPQNNNIV